MSSRVMLPLLGDHLGGAELRDLLRRRSAPAQPFEPRERIGEAERLARRSSPSAIGIMLMFCTPPATTTSLRAAHHRLRGEVHGLLRRAALAVDRRARHLLGQAGREPAGAGDVAGLRADRVDAAEDDVLDGRRVDVGALDERLEHVRAEVGRVHAGAGRRLRLPTGVRTASTM